eukprot:TRINITY_DN13179_c0_g2_i1.p1 TRINITY_DN13179_c0_g2~~TRINITY_DN13179_c0_g2_i1.p1  ORF type:complete len:139 (+),score=15.82 TRINITY_DN13179_c0_g2_i1:2691-3107(+)
MGNASMRVTLTLICEWEIQPCIPHPDPTVRQKKEVKSNKKVKKPPLFHFPPSSKLKPLSSSLVSLPYIETERELLSTNNPSRQGSSLRLLLCDCLCSSLRCQLLLSLTFSLSSLPDIFCCCFFSLQICDLGVELKMVA